MLRRSCQDLVKKPAETEGRRLTVENLAQRRAQDICSGERKQRRRHEMHLAGGKICSGSKKRRKWAYARDSVSRKNEEENELQPSAEA